MSFSPRVRTRLTKAGEYPDEPRDCREGDGDWTKATKRKGGKKKRKKAVARLRLFGSARVRELFPAPAILTILVFFPGRDIKIIVLGN